MDKKKFNYVTYAREIWKVAQAIPCNLGEA